MRDMVEALKLPEATPETCLGLSLKIMMWSQGGKDLFVLRYLERNLYRFFSRPAIEGF